MSGILASLVSSAAAAGGGGGGGGVWTPVLEYYYSPDAGSATNPGQNTTGADFIVVMVGTYQDWLPVASSSGLTDNKGNTYTACTEIKSNNGINFFFANVSGSGRGTGHTWTPAYAGPTNYAFMGVLAFSGGGGAVSLDGQAQRTGNLAFNTGSVTPTGNHRLLVSGIFNYAVGGLPSVDGSMTTTLAVAKSSNIGMGGFAWKEQSVAAAFDSTWSATGLSGSGNSAMKLAAFKQ